MELCTFTIYEKYRDNTWIANAQRSVDDVLVYGINMENYVMVGMDMLDWKKLFFVWLFDHESEMKFV